MMQHPYTYIMCMLLAAATLLSACSADSEWPSGEETHTTIAFDASFSTDSTLATRAVGEINEAVSSNNTPDDELSHYGGFGVFACYTGLHKYADVNVRPDFMYNEHVTYDTDHWTYSPLKYWPNGEGEATGNTGQFPHYVSFFAYAPYSDTATNPEGYCISAFSAQNELGNPRLTYRLHANVANQVDLLYAPAQLDLTKPTVSDKVSFTFKHALACVGDVITINCATGLKNQADSRIKGAVTNAKVEVSSFKIMYTLTEKARMVLWNSGTAPNWQTIQSENATCTRTVTLIDSGSSSSDKAIYTYPASSLSKTWSGQGVFYIPIELFSYVQTAKVSVNYHISTSTDGTNWTNDADIVGTATLILHDYPEAYQPGKHLYINVTLNQMDIALTAAIAPWIEVDPVNVEGIEE